MSKLHKVQLSRDEQIIIALGYAQQYEAAKRTIHDTLLKIKANLSAMAFDDDIESGLWSLFDNTHLMPHDITTAIADSDIYFHARELKQQSIVPEYLPDQLNDSDRGTYKNEC